MMEMKASPGGTAGNKAWSSDRPLSPSSSSFIKAVSGMVAASNTSPPRNNLRASRQQIHSRQSGMHAVEGPGFGRLAGHLGTGKADGPRARAARGTTGVTASSAPRRFAANTPNVTTGITTPAGPAFGSSALRTGAPLRKTQPYGMDSSVGTAAPAGKAATGRQSAGSGGGGGSASGAGSGGGRAGRYSGEYFDGAIGASFAAAPERGARGDGRGSGGGRGDGDRTARGAPSRDRNRGTYFDGGDSRRDDGHFEDDFRDDRVRRGRAPQEQAQPVAPSSSRGLGTARSRGAAVLSRSRSPSRSRSRSPSGSYTGSESRSSYTESSYTGSTRSSDRSYSSGSDRRSWEGRRSGAGGGGGKSAPVTPGRVQQGSGSGRPATSSGHRDSHPSHGHRDSHPQSSRGGSGLRTR